MGGLGKLYSKPLYLPWTLVSYSEPPALAFLNEDWS
jgi:hypothetical protein